jgi:hypothetical protein
MRREYTHRGRERERGVGQSGSSVVYEKVMLQQSKGENEEQAKDKVGQLMEAQIWLSTKLNPAIS